MRNFYGNRDEWLKKYVYLQPDFQAKDFVTNLKYVTIEEKLKMGYQIEEPVFIELADGELPFH